MVVIRAAVASDLPSIARIYNALLESTTYEWTETRHTVEELGRWLEEQHAGGCPVVVADDGDEVVGWGTYGDFRDATRWPGYRFTVEHSIHVAQSHWGRGVGRALVVHLGEHARREGKRVMVAGIDASNRRSIAFHAKLGFEEVARMPGVGDKWGQRLDLVLMQRDLTQRPKDEPDT
ncbi:MAG: family N-acetyltransferase [Acidimicrobiales bacterium]|nr:family N-acetyltransferase [Acidimicrobiales bacterium]